MDRLFAGLHAGKSLDIPTAVGFCMLITRECREAVGPFDEEAFGQGYGEEVDFCMRATRQGFRNLLCADAFVFHEGEVSFGKSGSERRLAAQKIVDERYPEFQARLREFLEHEPARALRRAVDLERLRTSRKPVVLFVSHDWGGGVQKHVDALADLVSADAEVLLLQPTHGGNLTLKWMRRGEEFRAWFERLEPELVALLRSLGVSRVHYHHVHGLPRDILGLADRLSVPFDVTLHDYTAYCPQYHLGDERGRYCGEPDIAGCEACVRRRPHAWGISVVQWRETFEAFLRRADRLLAPSHDLALRIVARYPGLPVQEWPHFEAVPEAMPPAFRIVLLGGLSTVKGLDVLEACVNDASRRSLPLHFRVIGHLGRALAQWPEAPLSITGSYPDERLDELLSLERADAVLFLSQVPESYSYTLTVAMRSGATIVAPDFGAFPERLKGSRSAVLFPLATPPAGINDLLLELLSPAVRTAAGD